MIDFFCMFTMNRKTLVFCFYFFIMTDSLCNTISLAAAAPDKIQSSEITDYPSIRLMLKVIGKIMKHYMVIQSQNDTASVQDMNLKIKKNEKLMNAVRALSEKISMYDIVTLLQKEYPEYKENKDQIIERTFRNLLMQLFHNKIDDALPIVFKWTHSMNLTFEDILYNIKDPDNIKIRQNKNKITQNRRVLQQINLVLNIGSAAAPFPFNIVIFTDINNDIVDISLIILNQTINIRPILSDLYYALNGQYCAYKMANPNMRIDFLSFLQKLTSEEIIEIFTNFKEKNKSN